MKAPAGKKPEPAKAGEKPGEKAKEVIAPATPPPAAAAAATMTSGKIGYPTKKPEKGPVAVPGNLEKKKGTLGLVKTPDGKFEISYTDYKVVLSASRYKKLFEAIPIDNSTLFRMLMSEILEDAEAKAAFRKIIATAGSSKPILDALQKQVQEIGLASSKPAKK
ncbi:MAG: hypothetical protein HZA54_00585 [Planctomycetes bacterium]|nr:hypothetical protein [Planctomycetota bacterium]